MRTAGARLRTQLRRREWGLLAAAMLTLVIWLSAPGILDRMNFPIQDAGLRLLARPAHPDIVLVAIDNPSLQAVGRWPWRRALHAELLARISEQSPRAIGLDVIFQEPDADYPGDDVLLAQALRAAGRVVLPVVLHPQAQGGHFELPLQRYVRSASYLGHVAVNVDADGLTRSLYLLNGPAEAPWPHLSWALRCAEGADLPACRLPSASPGVIDSAEWTKDALRIIPFAAGAQPFPTYSYVDVLKGQVPTDAFRDKYVLVGATATGLGDLFAVPVSPLGRRVPGVEMLGHVLNGELQGIRIQPAPAAWNTLLCVVPVAAALLAVLLLGPSAALLTTAGLFVTTILISLFSPLVTGWQPAPAAALIGLLLTYPLWSWRRLSAAAQFLRLEMQSLRTDGLQTAGSPGPGVRMGVVEASGDFLDRRINAVDLATQQLRELHEFVSDSLHQLPSPIFVCDAFGTITLANAAALRYAATLTRAHPLGQNIGNLLHTLRHVDTGEPLLPASHARWVQPPPQQEGRDDQGRTLLTMCKAFTTSEAGTSSGWLITLVDLTDLHLAIQQRDQALHFISHDIRSPNASILTMLEMQREYPDLISHDELLTRIERYARSSLGMAESFVSLASAQAQTYRFESLDLAALVAEAVDDAWAAAQERRVQIALALEVDCALCQGDRSLIGRALANVLGNAIKFSPEAASVVCTLSDRAPYWSVAVRDSGPGIPLALQGRLFQPFQRLHNDSHPSIGGIGLGLALAHTVVQRHGGRIDLWSEVDRGTEFRLLFPQPSSPPSAQHRDK